MGELKVKDKEEVVVPGQVVATGMDYLPAGGAFRDGDNIIASQVGIVNVAGRLIKLVPLNIKYVPKRGDRVIGRIADISSSNWYVDIGFSNEAAINLRDGSQDYIPMGADLTQYFNYGDYVIALITNVSRDKKIDLSVKGPGLRKLSEGRIIKINPAKVPRVIGKEGSMVSMVKQMTDCRIIVGQNGWIWLSCVDPENEKVALEAIKMIDERAHIHGLTSEVNNFLEKKVGGKKSVVQQEA